MKCVGPTLAPEEIAEIRRSLEFAPELEEAAELFTLASNATRLKILFALLLGTQHAEHSGVRNTGSAGSGS